MTLGETLQNERVRPAILLDARLYGKTLPPEPGLGRSLAELIFIWIGVGIAWIGARIPSAGPANRFTAFLARRNARRPAQPLDDPSRSRVEQAGRLSRQAEPAPKILFVTSHPKTTREESYLLGHMLLHSLDILKKLSPEPRFHLVQAVDAFALDTLPFFLQGIYAGYIGWGHVALDRLPGRRPHWVSAWILHSRFHQAIFHLLRVLEEGGAVGLALGGAVQHNGRILYVGKEWAFSAFAKVPPGKRRVDRRDWDEKAREILISEDGAALKGHLSPNQKQSFIQALQDLGMDARGAAESIRTLEEELVLQTPTRLRFFRILARRLVAKGRPVLIVPLKHTAGLKIEVGEPVLLSGFERKSGTLSVGLGNQPIERVGLEDFFKKWVRKNLNDI